MLPTSMESLQDEMLGLLEPYRQPTNNGLAERLFFFDPDRLKWPTWSGYEAPSFLKTLEQEGIADDLLKSIREYVRESELRKIELSECSKLKRKFSDAERIYANSLGSSAKRNAAVVRALGLSTGRRPPKFDGYKLWVDYVFLVRKKGMSPSQALKKVHKKHGRQSEDATLKVLNDQRTSLLTKIAHQYSEMHGEAKKRLERFVPTRRPAYVSRRKNEGV